MYHDDLEFHNVGDLRSMPEGDGLLIQRVPEATRIELNEGAQSRMCHPAGVELRFVLDESETVELTLSTIPQNDVHEGTVRVFWGPFQETDEYVVGETPETLALSFPERLDEIRPEELEDLAFDPRVCRVRLPGEHRGGHVVYHGLEGAVRPPHDEELPSRRYLAYGTSITEGEAPVAEHLTYVSQTARRLGADLLNLGSCGTAYCDTAMAEHIAAREDWDVVTLSLSVNMVDRFTPEEFRERASRMVETVASAHPTKPVVCITIFPNAGDVCVGADGECERFREELRAVVAETPHENVHLLEGPTLLPTLAGLTPDLVHPGDDAMIQIGENLAAELETVLADER